GDDPSSCEWEELPDSQLQEIGEPPPVEVEGSELALESLKILGADVTDPDDPDCDGEDGSCQTRRCAECHSVSRSGLEHWLELTEEAWNVCGLDRDPEDMSPEDAMTAVDCMRVEPSDPDSVFAAEKIGILTTGVQYGYFRELFRKAYGDAGWLPHYLQFRARVSMPKGGHPELTQLEYETLKKWFGSGLGNMEDHINDPPPPETCEPSTSPALSEHIERMQYEGWEALNEDRGIRMYGCGGSDDTSACFTGGEFPDRSADWGNDVGTLREVTELGFRTSFWTRSSADGRFVGNGGGADSGATITDLQRGVDIGVDASYDPGFFPDNSGFIFQGGGAGICAQSILETQDHVDFQESECITARGINLYQHVARGLGGGDYFIINSQFTSDSGGAQSDPAAHFNAGSTMKFTPMAFDGTTYQQLDNVVIESPYEGDSVLSPSTEMVVSRLAGPDGEGIGYVLRKVEANQFGDRYNVSIDEKLATICMPGAKANISFDERFAVTHHYDGTTANILLVDLLTGEEYQVTDMPANAEALFPHFRSDGWFYFLVSAESGERYIVASDAAVQIRDGSTGGDGTTRPAESHGDVVISEIMYDPDATLDSEGEWIEVHNPTSDTIELSGCTVDSGGSSSTIGSVSVAPGGYATFARSTMAGFTPDGTFTGYLSNTGGSVGISCGGTVIDTVSYGDTGFPRATGASLSLGTLDASANDDGAAWCTATEPYGTGDLGTPGGANGGC
ncbi:MAG: lamin tail domain-containing protein, partial [Polyangiales bacterium]